jgi:hypothetical protein
LRRGGQLISDCKAVVPAKSPPNTLYGYDSMQRALRLYALTGNEARRAQYLKLIEPKRAVGATPD